MAKILKVIELGNPILRTKAKPVSKAKLHSKEFQTFIDSLVKTCEAKNGVGIAAPQVGRSDRVFILWSRPNKRYRNVPHLGPVAIINPKIVAASKKIAKGFEGCLSIPGIRGIVPRYQEIDVEFLTREGIRMKLILEDFPARIFQHEFDHLNGVMFLDRVEYKSLLTEEEYKKMMKQKRG